LEAEVVDQSWLVHYTSVLYRGSAAMTDEELVRLLAFIRNGGEDHQHPVPLKFVCSHFLSLVFSDRSNKK
jgi:hypothetical protein